jgi:hypothetical protein
MTNLSSIRILLAAFALVLVAGCEEQKEEATTPAPATTTPAPEATTTPSPTTTPSQ